ncbi:replication protein B [Sodalis sp. dw_96]|uniref:replication protein B n=1 Tax=Sodalis sp. dw_96 TaxID=2719794 RepID=UPI001BD58ED2|nr:replication protein B [Sodalis sp. dw_96]
MNNRFLFKSYHIRTLPDGIRNVIGKYFATQRWQATCAFYDKLPERYRATVCFHAGLKKQQCTFGLVEMDIIDREKIVMALDEIRCAFNDYAYRGPDRFALVEALSLSERKTLYFHASKTPIELENSYDWTQGRSPAYFLTVLCAFEELCQMFDDAPVIITAVKPSEYELKNPITNI